MANNIQFITSISRQTDFEDIVRQVAQFIYGAEAYLVGGPYDGGLDLIYKAAGREIKEPVQITIQEKNLEAKVLDDAKKTKELVDKYGYPERLTLFWSRTLSNSKRLALKKRVREETGIGLEVYDATQLDQIITEDCPDVLNYLIRHIHKIDISQSGAVDPKDRAFYDYLALGKDAADLKASIIDAQIVSVLFSSSPSKAELIGTLESAGIRPGVSAARISALVSSGRLVQTEQEISLSSTERHRISNILAKDDAERIELLEKLRTYSVAAIKHDISKEALDLILYVYRVSSVDIQVSEIEFEPPRMTMAKDLVHKLEMLIQAKG
jgi:hypothetical protein